MTDKELFVSILESLTYRTSLSWKEEGGGEAVIHSGELEVEDEKYVVHVLRREMNLPSKTRGEGFIKHVDEIHFDRIIDGKVVTTLTDSNHPSKVFGAIFNGAVEGVSKFGKDAEIVVFSAKHTNNDTSDGFKKRSKLYETFARRLPSKLPYEYIGKKIVNSGGDWYILYSNKLNLTVDEVKNLESGAERMLSILMND
jgi:hypothetical protein